MIRQQIAIAFDDDGMSAFYTPGVEEVKTADAIYASYGNWTVTITRRNQSACPAAPVQRRRMPWDDMEAMYDRNN